MAFGSKSSSGTTDAPTDGPTVDGPPAANLRISVRTEGGSFEVNSNLSADTQGGSFEIIEHQPNGTSTPILSGWIDVDHPKKPFGFGKGANATIETFGADGQEEQEEQKTAGLTVTSSETGAKVTLIFYCD